MGLEIQLSCISPVSNSTRQMQKDASVERMVAHGSSTVLFYNRKSSRYVQKSEFQAVSAVIFFFFAMGNVR